MYIWCLLKHWWQITPSDHAMNFLNSDFISGTAGNSAKDFREFYLSMAQRSPDDAEKWRLEQSTKDDYDDPALQGKASPAGTLFWNTLVLSERTVVNYRRNLLAYGVRAGMYAGESDVYK